jgi:hypothetical protein
VQGERDWTEEMLRVSHQRRRERESVKERMLMKESEKNGT